MECGVDAVMDNLGDTDRYPSTRTSKDNMPTSGRFLSLFGGLVTFRWNRLSEVEMWIVTPDQEAIGRTLTPTDLAAMAILFPAIAKRVCS